MNVRLVLVAGFLLGSAGAAGAGFDSDYPWCAHYAGERSGGVNCSFATYQQCQWAISGVGGVCSANLFYAGPAHRANEPRPLKRAKRRAH